MRCRRTFFLTHFDVTPVEFLLGNAMFYENPDELSFSDVVLPPPPSESKQSLLSPSGIWTDTVPPSVEIVIANRQQGPKQLLFTIISSASQQGGLMLTDGLGYRYAVRYHSSDK